MQTLYMTKQFTNSAAAKYIAVASVSVNNFTCCFATHSFFVGDAVCVNGSLQQQNVIFGNSKRLKFCDTNTKDSLLISECVLKQPTWCFPSSNAIHLVA